MVWFPQVDYGVEARLVAKIRIKAATTPRLAKKVTGCVPAYYGPTLVPSYQIVMGRSDSRDGEYENLDLHFFRIHRGSMILRILKDRKSSDGAFLKRTDVDRAS
jgi:hypothetical protein